VPSRRDGKSLEAPESAHAGATGDWTARRAPPHAPARMQITVLTHLQKERDAKSYDVVIDQVSAALTARGHEVTVFGVHNDMVKLVEGLKERKPDLIFNLMETFGKTEFGSIGVVGLLDLLGLPYTGGGPGEFYLQEDKGITKKILAYANIPYPAYAVIPVDADSTSTGDLRFPMFVKPLRMDASIGISAKSLVRTQKGLLERIHAIHKLKDSALVEEFIEGREFFVGLLGNKEPQVLPVLEVDFTGMPPGAPNILDAKAKWDKESPEYKGSKVVVAKLGDELRERLQQVALDAYRALRVRDYGRVDLRMDASGAIYVIEVNASCYLERASELAVAAQAAGIEYEDLIEKIVQLALERRR
jgi:D-alanine-D-alanine ligase